ncbi:MAG TPA: sulfatase-like hydrolase/transferase, partial [Candidatus Hydrogenedentes bacterium]|nr:sulfatase-like hydrolase/transferase [Candidatus Hydrogenedentota bacterium]
MRSSSRRAFLKQAGAASALLLSAGGGVRAAEPGPKRPPNVVFILTDDQGYGDLGCTGNPVLQTPRIDSLRRDGAWIRRFYACPVCTPTRACLMTGRYNYRTRAIDTYLGRAMMDPAEVTLAELLRARGYRTGLFGKWHLGDNYPMRPMDKGFDESLWHKGGGICQPSEPDNKTYFDPVLSHNGKDVRAKGYCTDVFADAAVAFIEANADRPFFAYLATNAPHNPLDVADAYWKPFAEKGLDEKTARIYGMIANLDENVG